MHASTQWRRYLRYVRNYAGTACDELDTFDDSNLPYSLDLALPRNGSIDRSAPAWTTSLFQSYTRTIDAFAKYDNMLIYNVGNEVVARANQTYIAPFIKAAARDIKAYLSVYSTYSPQ